MDKKLYLMSVSHQFWICDCVLLVPPAVHALYCLYLFQRLWGLDAFMLLTRLAAGYRT